MKKILPAALLLPSLFAVPAQSEPVTPAGTLAQSFYPADDDDRPELFLPEEGDSDPENFYPEEGDSNADNYQSPDLDELALAYQPVA